MRSKGDQLIGAIGNQRELKDRTELLLCSQAATWEARRRRTRVSGSSIQKQDYGSTPSVLVLLADILDL
ncbi:MAG: hypothetical protein HKL81_05695 [Acidimicrobiaceae bacterium]|nr:hypothetical protein [Acidimicrobiaceae bacterium]